MKQFISLVLILGSLFSCVKEEDHPVTFQYDYNSVTTPNIVDYNLVLTDTALQIMGTQLGDTLRITIPKMGGNPLVVGEYKVSADNGFSIMHTSESGITTKASEGTLNLTHVNSFVNFTFDAVLYNGVTLGNGKAKNLPFITEAEFNSDTTNVLPDFPVSNVDTLTNGIYAEIQDVINPFYEPASNVITTQTDSTIIYLATDGFYSLRIELDKPLNNLVGNTYDLSQAFQDQVRMTWRDLSSTGPSDILEIQQGIFHVFDLDLINGDIEFGFGGQIYNLEKTTTHPIHVGYGKKIKI